MEELQDRLMRERMAEISQRVAAQSAEAAHAMDTSAADGLE
jgi:hypothetical protein